MNEQSLRPLGLGEIIDTAFKIYKRHWKALMLLVAVAVVPAGVASYLILSAAVPPDLAQFNDPDLVIDDALLEEILRFIGAALLAAVIQSAGVVLASAWSVRAVAEIYLGAEPDWRRSPMIAMRRLPAILVTGLLIIVAIGALSAGGWLLAGVTTFSSGSGGAVAALALIAWMVLVPWLVISWALAIPVLVIEGTSPSGALTRSFNLVRRRWWPTFGTLITAWLIVAVLSSIASRILEAFLPDAGGLITGMAVSVAIAVATTPFFVSVLAVLYFDLRTRREPFDLVRLAADIGAPAPSNPEETPRTQLPPGPDRPDWPPFPPPPEREGPPPME